MRPLPSSNGWMVKNHRWANPAFSSGSLSSSLNQPMNSSMSEGKCSASGAEKCTVSLPMGPLTTLIGRSRYSATWMRCKPLYPEGKSA